jgi:phosphoglycerate dehydrogenase-like enzyme
VSNARGAHGPATAELAVAGLLAVWRHLPRYVLLQQRGVWQQARPRGDSLEGAHVLVLGAGDVAREAAKRLRGFDAHVTLTGRTAREGVHAMSDLPQLLPEAEAVIVALPLNAGTQGLVDAAFLGRLPDGATLVNVARGGVVVTDALVAELERGRLRAFLDVTDPEPLPAGHPLWALDGVLITPHEGGQTHGIGRRALAVAVAQLQQFASGRLPDNLVPRADLI